MPNKKTVLKKLAGCEQWSNDIEKAFDILSDYVGINPQKVNISLDELNSKLKGLSVFIGNSRIKNDYLVLCTKKLNRTVIFHEDRKIHELKILQGEISHYKNILDLYALHGEEKENTMYELRYESDEHNIKIITSKSLYTIFNCLVTGVRRTYFVGKVHFSRNDSYEKKMSYCKIYEYKTN
jgi:hypothetical protein